MSNQTLSSRLNAGVSQLASASQSGLVGGTSAAQTLAPTITLPQQLTAQSGVLYGGGGTQTVLNWYEEGTWTPSFNSNSGTVSATYTIRSGSFTRIGRVVYFQFELAVSAVSGGTGNLQITGLPYTANAGSFTPFVGFSTVSDIAVSSGNQQILGLIDAGTTTIEVVQQAVNTTATSTTTSHVVFTNTGSSAEIFGAGFYFI